MAAAIDADLRALGTPERADTERRYLRSSLAHVGVTVRQVRAAVTAHIPGRVVVDVDALVEISAELWAAPVHELRLAAAVTLQRHNALLTAKHLPFIYRLLDEANTWALVDVLADKAAGEVVRREPREALAHLDGWATDPNKWVRRAVLLTMLPSARADVLPDRFWDYADAMLDEREFFVAKALGWVLREYARRSPRAVFDWLAPRLDRTTTVTLREATKYLEPRHQAVIRTRRRTLGR